MRLGMLYELPAAFAAYGEALAESGGELTPEIEAEFGGLEAALIGHADDAAALVQTLRAAAAAAEAESRRLRDLARGREAAAARVMGLVKAAMEAAGERRIDTDRFRLTVARNGRPSIRWTLDPEKLPEEFRRVVVTPDGEKAYEAFRAGSLPPGFEVQQGTHLRIG